MKRIQWVSAFAAIALFGRVFLPIFPSISPLAVVSLIALAGYIILWTMPANPVTEFIHPPRPDRSELATKILMIHHARASSGHGRVRLFFNGIGWIEGTVIDLSESKGVLLLKMADGSDNEMYYLKDVVRVSTVAHDLGIMLRDPKPELPSLQMPRDVH